MYTLAMDTSNNVLAVAILKNRTVIGEFITNLKKNHSVRLMPAIDLLMEEVGVESNQLEKIVVAKGPGSYTGVRIGLTTAKTLAWALNVPLIGVSSLESLAYQTRFYNGLICPFFDARRGMVYIGGYEWNQNKMSKTLEETNILMTDWLDILVKQNKEVLFLSPDIGQYKELIKEKMGQLAIIPEDSFHIARASDLAFAGEHHAAVSPHVLTPNYLRMAEAEAKWKQAQEERENNG